MQENQPAVRHNIFPQMAPYICHESFRLHINLFVAVAYLLDFTIIRVCTAYQ